MENKHLSGRIKSGYLMTLMFSFTDYFEGIESLLRRLSKKGSSFLENNREQLTYFCPPKPDKALTLTFSKGRATYYAPCYSKFSKLVLKIRGIKEDNYDNLHQIARRIPKYHELKIEGDISISQQSDQTVRKIQEQFIESIEILISKAVILNAQKFSPGTLIPTIIQSRPEKFKTLKKATFNASSLFQVKDFNQMTQITGLDCMCPIGQDTKPSVNFETIWDQLEELKFGYINRDRKPNRSLHFSMLKPGLPKLTNLKILSMTMLPNFLQVKFKAFSRLISLEEFYSKDCIFDFKIIEHWPKLHTLYISRVIKEFEAHHCHYLQQIKNLALCFSESGVQQTGNNLFWKSLEKSPKLEWISFSETPSKDGLSFLNQNSNVKYVVYKFKSSSYENILSHLHADSKIIKLRLYHSIQNTNVEIPKVEKARPNYSIEMLTFESTFNNFTNWSKLNLSLLKNLRKIEINKQLFDQDNRFELLLEELLKVENSKLQQMKIKYCAFNMNGMNSFAKFLENPNIKLKDLELFKYMELFLGEFQSLAEWLSRAHKLETFKLSTLRDINFKDAKAFLGAVKGNQNLKHFELKVTIEIGDSTREQLDTLKVLLLQNCTHLRKLVISLREKVIGTTSNMSNEIDRWMKEVVKELRMKMLHAEYISISS